MSDLLDLERLRQQFVTILRAKGKLVPDDAKLATLVHLVEGIDVNTAVAGIFAKTHDFEIVDDGGLITASTNPLILKDTYVTKLVLPAFTSTNGEQNFQGTSRLNYAEMGTDAVSTYLGAMAFRYSAMQTFKGGYVSTGDSTFASCNNLVKAEFKSLSFNSVATFVNCTNLKIVDFGTASAVANRTDTFKNCSSIKALVFRNTDGVSTLAGTGTFAYLLSNVTGWYIYVPDALVDSYKVASNWSTYADYFKPLSEYDEEAILSS